MRRTAPNGPGKSALQLWDRLLALRHNRDISSFFSRLSIVFIFRLLSAALNLLGLTLAARYQGVTALGDIVTVQNAAYFLIIPIVIGVPFSIIKYLPLAAPADAKRLIGSVWTWNLLLTAGFLLLYVLLAAWFSGWTHLSPLKWGLSVSLAVALNFSTVLEAVLRAQNKFFLLSASKMIGTVVFFLIVLLYAPKADNFSYFIGALVANFAIFAVIAWFGSGIRSFGFSWPMSRKLYGFGAINMVSGTLSMLLFSSDLFIVNYFCSAYDVGVYSVYQINVRNFFNLMFFEVFAVVFLPAIAHMDKIRIYKTVLRMIPWLLPLSVAANAVLCLLLLFMYGSGYTLHWTYVGFVSASTGFHFIYWVFNSVFTIEGRKGATLNLIVLGLPLPLLLLATVGLTMKFGITGTMLASLLTQLVLLGTFILFIQRRYLPGEAGKTAIPSKEVSAN
ncbi:oligosaccharide flippase family protein [Paenibacillus athensensis]|uniref:lipopolysaccharide biosynthesis protein n=1 Tax=Paenibacillus athensensis TaxID=1967502 RepID=UPI0014319886|nr:oligosaccharide flippase family protein [Paenibacillus athensensis]MCD1258462.1 oligosaccharide flippase family protein [Paenibacillus athensensis]